MGSLKMYDDFRMKNYIESRFVTEGISANEIDEVINLVKKI